LYLVAAVKIFDFRFKISEKNEHHLLIFDTIFFSEGKKNRAGEISLISAALVAGSTVTPDKMSNGLFFGIDGEGSPKVIHFFAFEHFTSSFCKRAEESPFPLKTAFFFSDGVETQENNRNIGMEKETSHYPSDLKLKKIKLPYFYVFIGFSC
jgi:hypothetical protein